MLIKLKEKMCIILSLLGVNAKRISYSQTGEDLIILDFLKLELGKKEIKYLDVGANDPKFLSNTYLMYKQGYQGILVEPNSKLCKKIKRCRKRDVVLNCGIAGEHGNLTYYMMESHTINSFSKAEIEEYIKMGYKLLGEKIIEVFTINEIFEKYGCVDFLSIDVEGLDFDILRTLDYTKYAPLVICIETAEHGGGKREDLDEVNQFMIENGYMIYADTMLNTIYVKREEFEQSRKRKN